MACFGDGVGPTPYAIDAAMACSGMDVASTASGATRTPSPRRSRRQGKARQGKARDAGRHAAPVADVVGDALAARRAERVGAERARDGDAGHVPRLYILREAAVAEVLLRPHTAW